MFSFLAVGSGEMAVAGWAELVLQLGKREPIREQRLMNRGREVGG